MSTARSRRLEARPILLTCRPEGTVVAENTTETTFTETIETDELRSVSYKITVYYDGEECFDVQSPAVLRRPCRHGSIQP